MQRTQRPDAFVLPRTPTTNIIDRRAENWRRKKHFRDGSLRGTFNLLLSTTTCILILDYGRFVRVGLEQTQHSYGVVTGVRKKHFHGESLRGISASCLYFSCSYSVFTLGSFNYETHTMKVFEVRDVVAL